MGKRDSDERVQRTRGWILEAFHDLFLQRGYGNIRVADIIRGAGVGRSTFYEHFQNKDELLTQSASAMLGYLADAVTDEGDLGRITHVVAHFWDYRRPGRALLNGPSGSQLTRSLADLVAERLTAWCRDGGTEFIIPVQLAAMQIAEAQFGLVRAWLNGAAACTAESVAAAIFETSKNLVNSIQRNGSCVR